MCSHFLHDWRFWSVEGTALAPKAVKAEKAAKTNGKKTTKVISETANQQALTESQKRWFCNACMASFVIEGDAEPEACPEGHRADDPELTGSVGAPEPATKTEEGEDADRA